MAKTAQSAMGRGCGCLVVLVTQEIVNPVQIQNASVTAMPRLLDLFCGRWGWSRAFAARGWECVGVDLVEHSETPDNCTFVQADVQDFWASRDGWIHRTEPFSCKWSERFSFIVASPPCEQFSLFGMKHFHPNPPHPRVGIHLFNHTRALCEASRLPYIIENVRPAQQFVGTALDHCGPFYLWGPGVPPLLIQGIRKGLDMGRDPLTGKRTLHRGRRAAYGSKARERDKAETATIPPELAVSVADYAERLLEQKLEAVANGDSKSEGT